MNSVISSSNPYFELMADHLTEAAIELFAACNLRVDRSQAALQHSLDELYCMSSLGYVGDGVRGVLVLAASHVAAKAWSDAAGIGECDHTDTVGEFANMMLGHLKARLLREGMPISLATPMTVSGAGLRFSIPPGRHSSWQFFDGPTWRLGARLDASFDAGFQVHEVDAAQPPAVAGDAMLF
jgi:hypothetical protein